MSMDSNKIEIRQRWDDALLRETQVMTTKSVAGGGYLTGIIGGIVSISVISIFYPGQFAAVVGLFLGYATIGIGTEWSQRRLMKTYVKQTLASPADAAESLITVSRTGMRIDHPLHKTELKWGCVMELGAGKLAVHAIVGPNKSIPLPDNGFPAGMTREDLCRSIENWREAETELAGI